MQLNYQRYGQGAPLIILHGLFGSLTNWNTLSKRFGEHYTVFAVDQRNHGASPHSDESSYLLMAEDLRDFMQEQSLTLAHLLGHSMGGKTAMQFALSYPELVEKLIVVDIAPKAYPPHHDTIFDALCELNLSEYTSRAELDRALASKIDYAPTRQFLLTNVTRDDAGRFAWKINLDGIYQTYDAIIGAIESTSHFDKPTLFVRGETSDYIQDEDRPQIETLFPQAQLVTVKGAGHWVHAEAPDAFFSTILAFLQAPGS
ncbi:MAG TPA: alpha/beta fold hydrolase [Herpetosiphonaceae bacterium]